jgi:hypothetical protein
LTQIFFVRICNHNCYIKEKEKKNMKANETNETRQYNSPGVAFSKACLKCGKQILAQIRNAKETILTEARNTLKVQEQMLRLAVNEAEALAWQTLYPQLVFPDLATEKIQHAAAWNNRQRLLLR